MGLVLEVHDDFDQYVKFKRLTCSLYLMGFTVDYHDMKDQKDVSHH